MIYSEFCTADTKSKYSSDFIFQVRADASDKTIVCSCFRLSVYCWAHVQSEFACSDDCVLYAAVVVIVFLYSSTDFCNKLARRN